MFSFKNISIFTALIACSLFAAFLFYPVLPFSLFGIEQSSSALFVSRRMAMLFLGFAILLWVARNAKHSESRQAICLSISVSMCALSGLGVFEFQQGQAGSGILLAVMIELTIAILYLKVWLSHKQIAVDLIKGV